MINLRKTIKNQETYSVVSDWDLIKDARWVPKLYELNGTEFCYIVERNCFILPKNASISLEDILREDTIVPWKLKKISQLPKKEYILNQYLRSDDSYIRIKSHRKKDITGEWVCFNGDEKIEFSMITDDRYAYKDDETILLTCFQEKTEIPYNPFKIKNKTDFILYNLWKNLQLEELSKK